MNRIKRLLGFYSPYSWMKWLKMGFAFAALIIAMAFWSSFGSMVVDGGVIGTIFALILFVVLFGPILLVLLGVATLVGIIIGGISSGVKQRKSFQEIAATGSEALMALEKLRAKAQLFQLLVLLATIGLVVLGVMLAVPLISAFGEAGLYGYAVFALAAFIGLNAAIAPANKRYKLAFKEQVVAKSLESVLSNVNFQPQEKLPEATIRACALFSPYDSYSGNDLLEADHNGHHFIQSDVHLQKQQEETYLDDDGHIQTRTIWVTLFHGRLTAFDYDTISNDPVAVYDKRAGKPKDHQVIQTELDAFNQKFYVTAPSPTAAFRILTPPVLEGIALAAGKLKHPLHLSFCENKLFVALANGDSFEAAGGDATLAEQRKKVTADIQAMLELVDTLYLKKEGGKTA